MARVQLNSLEKKSTHSIKFKNESLQEPESFNKTPVFACASRDRLDQR